MIKSFADAATKTIFDGESTKKSRKVAGGAQDVAKRKLDMINAAVSLTDLEVPPANRLEALKGDLKGSFSIRINDQWRITFRWEDSNAHDVKIVDYH